MIMKREKEPKHSRQGGRRKEKKRFEAKRGLKGTKIEKKNGSLDIEFDIEIFLWVHRYPCAHSTKCKYIYT